MTTRLYSRSLSELAEGHTDYGFCDQKGRAVGYWWAIYKAVFTPQPEDAMSGYTGRHVDSLGHEHLMVKTSPTRDGKSYGASSDWIHCATRADADAAIAKRTANARRRDAKKFQTNTGR